MTTKRPIHSFHKSATLVALCATCLISAPLWAEEDTQAAKRSAVANASSDDELTEVVVTAERRKQDLQKAAISATVLSAEALEEKGVVGLSGLQYAVPGVIIADYGSANTFNIRGVGQARVDVDLPSGVVIYRDGVPTLTGYFQNAPYYDMAGIEVLRGPQGTFGGKSASAGAVFIRTHDPELGKFGGDAMVGYGNKDFRETTAVLNLPLGETFAVRLAYHGEWRDSLFDSITSNNAPGGTGAGGPYSGSDQRRLNSIRLGLLWQPSDDLKAVLKIDGDNLYFGSHITTGLDPVTGATQDIRNPVVNGPHYYDDHGMRLSLNLTYNLNGYSLNSLTGFSNVNSEADWDPNGADPTPFTFFSHGVFRSVSQELDLISPTDDKINWVSGVFWQQYHNSYEGLSHGGFGFDLNDTPGVDYGSPWLKDERTYAIFGQVGYHFTPALELQIGARYGHYGFSQFTNFYIDTSGFAGGPSLPLTPLENGGLGNTQTLAENSVDWKANVNYQLTDEHFLYGLISRGHSPGSINFASPSFFANPDHGAYSQEKVTNYEVGLKSTLLDRKIHTQLDVYYQVFKDYQADFALGAGVGPANTQLFQFQNALTDSKIYGAEFGAQGNFGDFAMDYGFAYNTSKLGSFGQVINTFAGVPGYDPRPTVDLKGSSTPFSPKITTNIGASYTVALPHHWKMVPRAEVAYRSDAYSRLFENEATLLPGYTLVNSQIKFSNETTYVEFWCNNVADKRYVSAKQNVDGAAPTAEYPFQHIVGIVYGGAPRLFGVRIGHSF
jgi:iron complex outermembrane receptor protein